MTAFQTPRRRALDHLIRPTRAEVSAEALRSNLVAARKLAHPAEVMAVVKANAYGHGAVQVARVLEEAGVAMLGVALVEEGVELRNAGVKTPILVMGGSYENGYGLLVEHRLTPTLFRREHIQGLVDAASRSGRTATAHLKLDTGMSRLGVQREELPEFLALLRAARGTVELEGFLSHFANADVQHNPLTGQQVERFSQRTAPGSRRRLQPAISPPVELGRIVVAARAVRRAGHQPRAAGPDALRFAARRVARGQRQSLRGCWRGRPA